MVAKVIQKKWIWCVRWKYSRDMQVLPNYIGNRGITRYCTLSKWTRTSFQRYPSLGQTALFDSPKAPHKEYSYLKRYRVGVKTAWENGEMRERSAVRYFRHRRSLFWLIPHRISQVIRDQSRSPAPACILTSVQNFLQKLYRICTAFLFCYDWLSQAGCEKQDKIEGSRLNFNCIWKLK